MNKIKTIFDRDWDGNRGVIDKVVVDFLPEFALATEKVDGTNVRVTVINHTAVRVEKRKNPSKLEKAKGIETPWYVDASESDPQDKYIFEAVRGTDFSNIPDGEWSAEAYGEKIQGNPLRVDGHRLLFFSIRSRRQEVAFRDVPTEYNKLKRWLPKQKSKINPNVGIEGIVWWDETVPIGKIKLKDFKPTTNKEKEKRGGIEI